MSHHSPKKLTQFQLFKQKPTLEEIKERSRNPFCLVVDNVRSLYNIGSFFRTADAVFIEKIYLCGITGHPPNKEIEKTALGAVEVVPWEYYESIEICLQFLKEEKYVIYGLEQTNLSKNYRKVPYKFPLALVVGNEVDGLSEKTLKYIDQAIDIPMLGRANSLNVTNAFAIAAYEILEQYNLSTNA